MDSSSTSIGAVNISSKARVVLLTNFLPPYRVSLLKEAAQLIPDLNILISTPMEANRQWQAAWDGLKVKVQHNLTFRQLWKHPKGFSEPLFIHIPYDTLYLLQQYKPDITLSSELGFRTLMAAIYRRLNPHNRLIIWATVSESSEQGRGRLRLGLRRWLLRQADAVLVNGSSGERYIRSLGIEKIIFYLPYSTNLEPMFAIAEGRSFSEQPSRLLYVGQLTPRKGLLEFAAVLKAWALRHPERQLSFRLVGGGELRGELEHFGWPTNLQIIFEGHVPYEQLAQVYADADMLVFPTLADEWGLVTNEALAAGLPVLGSVYSQAVEELIQDGQNGWLIRPDDPQQMAEVLERALACTGHEMTQKSQGAVLSVTNLDHKVVLQRLISAIEYVKSGIEL